MYYFDLSVFSLLVPETYLILARGNEPDLFLKAQSVQARQWTKQPAVISINKH